MPTSVTEAGSRPARSHARATSDRMAARRSPMERAVEGYIARAYAAKREACHLRRCGSLEATSGGSDAGSTAPYIMIRLSRRFGCWTVAKLPILSTWSGTRARFATSDLQQEPRGDDDVQTQA